MVSYGDMESYGVHMVAMGGCTWCVWGIWVPVGCRGADGWGLRVPIGGMGWVHMEVNGASGTNRADGGALGPGGVAYGPMGLDRSVWTPSRLRLFFYFDHWNLELFTVALHYRPQHPHEQKSWHAPRRKMPLHKWWAEGPHKKKGPHTHAYKTRTKCDLMIKL